MLFKETIREGKDKQKKKAVNKLNLEVYRGQVTALLGHNGAGKSTTFSMLTVTKPTSGTAYINDYDICKALPKIRSYLGICPQYNILFGTLTVLEHLEFFCKVQSVYSLSKRCRITKFQLLRADLMLLSCAATTVKDPFNGVEVLQ
ncbi:unnamed protein product [Anisakis simplex]|uniref:ABC transporter domain-containing protein n=1 Tax=Anisakis simplex TaxID=6269 RepID=A0A0M3KGE7_ANISI|nr:unnamed protein product [Anisakis simplex]